MTKIEKFINFLQAVLLEMDKEIAKSDSIWDKEFLNKWGKAEMNNLLSQAQSGKIDFDKYGRKKYRMLQTTYFMTDVFEPLAQTSLGIKILELEQLFEKL